MPELKGSKTEDNLLTAFAGESQARNKYTNYASNAKKDGYLQIAAIFEETANNEKEHAKMWFKPVSYTHLQWQLWLFSYRAVFAAPASFRRFQDVFHRGLQQERPESALSLIHIFFSMYSRSVDSSAPCCQKKGII